MKIGEVSKRSNLPTSTIRYYEEKGLIKSIARQGITRVFAPSILEKLSLITLGRKVGFSLDEIAAMLVPQGQQLDRLAMLSKADELDKQIKEITAMRDGLRHAAACDAPSHMECPKFRRILNIVGKRRHK